MENYGWRFRVAAGAALLGVALGAFGAHALKDALVELGTLDTWKTAVLYQLVHAVVMLVLAERAVVGRSGAWWAWGFFAGGVVLFSGSLYGLALGGPGWLGPVTPLGGLAFMIGWGRLVVAPR